MEEESQGQTALCSAIANQAFSDDDSHEWMRTLVKIGAWIASAEPSCPLTVALCLPRVEFAGLLVASGACLHAAQSPVSADWRAQLSQLVGKRIAYSLCGNPYVYWEGVLRQIEPSNPETVRIQGTRNSPADAWLLTDLASIQLDPERDAQELADVDQGKKAFRDERSNRLRTVLPESAVGKLCSWWHKLTLVGTRSRLAEELNQPFPWKAELPAGFTFADLLRPEGCVADSVITRMCTPKDLASESSFGIVLLEGSRRLSEYLSATQQHYRVILLGRNEPHYSDSAEIVVRHFQQRTSDAAGPELDCPKHINLKIFHH